jgi:hypothetical protein
METTTSNKLTNLQMELLKIFSINMEEQELYDIKNMLSEYFAKRAVDGANKVWKERGYTNEMMDDLINDENQ